MLMFNFCFTVEGERCGHSVVSESYSDEGILALCSGPAAGDGHVVKWAYTEEDKQEEDGRPHGCKIIVPWLTQDYDKWMGFAIQPLGIGRDFITVIPV